MDELHQNMAGCFYGDFNAIRREDERKGIRGGSSQRKEISGFNCFIDANSMVDIPSVDKKYTWFKPNGTAKVGWIESWFQKNGFRSVLSISNMCNKELCPIIVLLWQSLGPKIGAINLSIQ